MRAEATGILFDIFTYHKIVPHPTKDTGYRYTPNLKNKELTHWGHAFGVIPCRGWQGGLMPPSTPILGGGGKEPHGRGAGSLGEDPSQPGGAGLWPEPLGWGLLWELACKNSSTF